MAKDKKLKRASTDAALKQVFGKNAVKRLREFIAAQNPGASTDKATKKKKKNKKR